MAKSLQTISSITELKIAGNYITDEAADDIAAVIQSNSKLQILDISANHFHTVGIIKIATSLQKIYSLTELNMYGSNITEEVADHIAAVILSNRNLQCLHIGGKGLETVATIKLSKALQRISALTKLDIKDSNITDEAADDIAAAILSNDKLQILNLSNNNLKAVGVIKITKALQIVTSLTELFINRNNVTDTVAYDIAAVVQSNSNLRKLDLLGNVLKATGAIKVAQAVKKYNKSSFLTLTIMDNYISEEAKDEIKAILSNNESIQCRV